MIIGAGGTGLRSAIEASSSGREDCTRVQITARQSSYGHGRGWDSGSSRKCLWADNWKVHFRDTMRGGKFLNNWRMAQIHAQEWPDRVLELEEWGALFDRTHDGLILQRDFGGHRYARLTHVGQPHWP